MLSLLFLFKVFWLFSQNSEFFQKKPYKHELWLIDWGGVEASRHQVLPAKGWFTSSFGAPSVLLKMSLHTVLTHILLSRIYLFGIYLYLLLLVYFSSFYFLFLCTKCIDFCICVLCSATFLKNIYWRDTG